MKISVFLLCLITGLSLSEITPIHNIQGSGDRSPLHGRVVTTQGVVTLVTNDGFFVQSIEPDDQASTSEGIFVYLGSQSPQLSVQQYVRITGKVQEYDQQTQLTYPKTMVTLGTRPLPPPVSLRPLAAAESIESMRVTAQGKIIDLYQLARFGSAKLNNGYWLDDTSFATYPELTPWQRQIRVGQSVTADTAIVVHRFDEYRLFANELILTGNPRPNAPDKNPDHLRVVAANLYNLFDGVEEDFSHSRGPKNASQWQRQLQKTSVAVQAMQPDILLVSEVENDYGKPETAIQKLASATGMVAISPESQLGDDAIAVGILYQPERVQPVGLLAKLTDIGFGNRVPIAQRFANQTGLELVVSPQHWKSKRCTSGSDCGQEARLAAAQQVANWLADFGENVLLAGDLNSYYQEPAWQKLVTLGWQSYTQAHDYSYLYRGQTGALDHAFTYQLNGWQAEVQYWHINADEAPWRGYRSDRAPLDATRFSDHDPIIIDLVPVRSTN